MAIVVEEKREGPGLLNTLGVVLALGLLFVGTYYLFFAPAPLVEIVAPSDLESSSEVSKIEINVNEVTDSALYKSLKEYVGKPEIVSPGRTNPFETF